jgi:hypothetical protein
MIYIGILSPYPGGWSCRIAGDYGSRCTGAEGLTPVEAIAAATDDLREWIDYWKNTGHQLPAPMTAQTVAAAGLAYDDETLVLIPIRPPRADPDFPDLTPRRADQAAARNKATEEAQAEKGSHHD